jgi:hypothetical protein
VRVEVDERKSKKYKQMKTHVEKRRGERNCFTCAHCSVDTFMKMMRENVSIRKRDVWQKRVLAGKAGS